VCVRERERVCVCMCADVRLCVLVREEHGSRLAQILITVCVFVCVRERDTQYILCVWVCVRERARKSL